MARILILISEELQAMLAADQGGRLSRALGQLNRADYRILAIAPRPERWRPTRSSMDSELSRQQALHEALDRTGATFDGVYYYATSWFIQQRHKDQMFSDIARRSGLAGKDLLLLSGFPKEIDSAREAGIEVLPLRGWEGDEPDPADLDIWVEALSQISQKGELGNT